MIPNLVLCQLVTFQFTHLRPHNFRSNIFCEMCKSQDETFIERASWFKEASLQFKLQVSQRYPDQSKSSWCSERIMSLAQHYKLLPVWLGTIKAA